MVILCNRLFYPPPTTVSINITTPAPSHPVNMDFIDSRGRLRKQLDFIYVVDSNDNANIITINNVNEMYDENFYDNEYDCGVSLSPHAPVPTPSPASILNGTIDEVSGIDILHCENSVCNGMINGM